MSERNHSFSVCIGEFLKPSSEDISLHQSLHWPALTGVSLTTTPPSLAAVERESELLQGLVRRLSMTTKIPWYQTVTIRLVLAAVILPSRARVMMEMTKERPQTIQTPTRLLVGRAVAWTVIRRTLTLLDPQLVVSDLISFFVWLTPDLTSAPILFTHLPLPLSCAYIYTVTSLVLLTHCTCKLLWKEYILYLLYH